MTNPLQKKLQIKQNDRVLIEHLPDNATSVFSGITFQKRGTGINTGITFCFNRKQLLNHIPDIQSKLTENGTLWVCYPKGSGNIKTDLNRDITAEVLAGFDLQPVRLIAVDENWSAMRLKKESERSQSSRFGQDPPGVDRKTRTVIPPDDLLKALDQHPEAKVFYEGLAFSHKREYVSWIHEAKKEETRARRIQKTIELLNKQRKAK